MPLISQFRPKTVDEFIGPARRAAEGLDRLATLASADGAPLRVLLLGPSGIGKTSLADYLALRLGATSRWHFTECRPVNGKEVNLEFIMRAAAGWRLTSLSEGYRVFQIEEADRMTADAQVVFLTMLDQMPPRTAVIASSNKPADFFEERLQRRFKVFPITGPTDEELTTFLTTRGLAAAAAKMVAVTACGNVGAALQDADLHAL